MGMPRRVRRTRSHERIAGEARQGVTRCGGARRVMSAMSPTSLHEGADALTALMPPAAAIRTWRDQTGDESAAFTRSGVNGSRRKRAPVASKIALPSAAATTVIDVSPAPVAGTSGGLMRTLSITGGE
jgi:hypothetical protein